MAPYLLCLFLILGCALVAIKPTLRIASLIVAFVALASLAGFRSNIGWDYVNYQFFYEAASELSLTDLLAPHGPAHALGFEPGFAILTWLLAIVGANYQLVFAVITIGFCLYAAYRISPEAVPLFLIVYLLLGYFHNFSILRQGLASALIFYAFSIFHGHKKLAVGTYFVASLFHASALFLSPIIAICVRLSNKKILLSVLALCWILSLTHSSGGLLTWLLTEIGRERWQNLLAIDQITGKVGLSFILVEYTIAAVLIVMGKETDHATVFARGVLVYRLLAYGLLNDISIVWERVNAFADPMYAVALAIILTNTIKRITQPIQYSRLILVFVTILMAIFVVIKYDRMLASKPRSIYELSHRERFIPYRSIFDDLNTIGSGRCMCKPYLCINTRFVQTTNFSDLPLVANFKDYVCSKPTWQHVRR